MDDDDTEVIELLDDQFTDALLGAVYDDEGTPVPCYSSAMVMDKMLMDKFNPTIQQWDKH